MICGADVTHPMPGEKSMSIASIVGTYDKDFMQYAGEARVQESRKEVITDMVGMMEGLFNNYYRKNNKVPQSLLFFRDGVGDTMFNLCSAKRSRRSTSPSTAASPRTRRS